MGEHVWPRLEPRGEWCEGPANRRQPYQLHEVRLHKNDYNVQKNEEYLQDGRGKDAARPCR